MVGTSVLSNIRKYVIFIVVLIIMQNELYVSYVKVRALDNNNSFIKIELKNIIYMKRKAIKNSC